MLFNEILTSNYLVFPTSFLIILGILFSSEKSVVDVFTEQYGGSSSQENSSTLDKFIFVLVFILFFSFFITIHN
jgi:preprotein translocase subunit SecG